MAIETNAAGAAYVLSWSGNECALSKLVPDGSGGYTAAYIQYPLGPASCDVMTVAPNDDVYIGRIGVFGNETYVQGISDAAGLPQPYRLINVPQLRTVGHLRVDNLANVYAIGSCREDINGDFWPLPRGVNPEPDGLNCRAPSEDTQYVLTVFDAADELSYGTFLGPQNNFAVQALEIDQNGTAYVAGITGAAGLTHLTADAFQTAPGLTTCSGSCIDSDAFLMVFDTSGTAEGIDTLRYSSFLGGANGEFTVGMARAADGTIYFTGLTYSQDFPLTTSQSNTTGSAFVSRLDLTQSGSSQLVSSVLAIENLATGPIEPPTIRLLPNGRIALMAETLNADFPLVAPFFNAFPIDTPKPLLIVVDPATATIHLATYLDNVRRARYPKLAVDAAGTLFVAMTTDEDGRATDGTTRAGLEDGLVMALTPPSGVNQAPTVVNLTQPEHLATSPDGVMYPLAGSATDADGDVLTAVWTGPFGTHTNMFQPGPNDPASFGGLVRLPIGDSTITLTVNDGGGGHTVVETFTVRVTAENTLAGNFSTSTQVVRPPDDTPQVYIGETPGIVELTLSGQVNAAGLVWLRSRTDQVPPPPAGLQLGSSPMYYELSYRPASTIPGPPIQGPVRVCIDYAGFSFAYPSDVHLYELANGTWIVVSGAQIVTDPADITFRMMCVVRDGTNAFTTYALMTPRDPATLVSTIVQMTNPTSSVYDVDAAAGRNFLYIADGQTFQVTRLNRTTGTSTIVAGNGTITFNPVDNVDATQSSVGPSGLAVDRFGNLFIADASHCRIRRVDHATNIITTLAGIGEEFANLCGHSGDGGPANAAQVGRATRLAFDPHGNLILFDEWTPTAGPVIGYLRRIAAVGGVIPADGSSTISTIAGNGTSDQPIVGAHPLSSGAFAYDIAFAPDGNLYVATNSMILRLTRGTGGDPLIDGSADERFERIAGGLGFSELPRFSGDGGLALDAYVDTPAAIAVLPNGDLLYAEPFMTRVRRIGGGADHVVNGVNDADCTTSDANCERIWTVAGFTDTVGSTYPPTSNGNGPALTTRLGYVFDIDVDPQGGIGVTEQGFMTVRHIGLRDAAAGTGADLDLTVTASPNPVDAGATVTYNVTVTNLGPATATGIAVSMPVPGGYAPTALLSAGFCIVPIFQFSGTINCDGGTLLPGQSRQITITLTPPVKGLLSSTITVSSASSDPVPGNNTRTFAVDVLDRMPPTAVIGVSSPVPVGDNLTASAVGSTDAGGGQIVRYVWTLIERSLTIETSVPAVTFSVTPASPLPVGPYTIQLIVFDDSGNASTSATATVLVIVPASLTASNDSYAVTRDSTLVSGVHLVANFPLPGFGDPERYLANVNGTLFFAERCNLRKSDGTPAGTVLVKNICATNLTNVNGILFFSGRDSNGKELWRSDGTEAGTFLVKDIVPGGNWSDPRDLTDVDGQLFFVASTVDSHGEIVGTELWRSDGTASGTALVKAFPLARDSLHLRNVSGTVFFRLGPSGGLWKSDGTADGTVLVRAGSVTADPFGLSLASLTFPFPSFPNWPITFNGNYAFLGRMEPGQATDELWVSDPAGNLVKLSAMNPPPDHRRSVLDIAAISERLYFGVLDTTIKPEDWDACLATFGDQYCFFNPPLTVVREVWTSDGTPDSATLLVSFGPSLGGARREAPFLFTGITGGVLFVQGSQLWKTDGTPGGTAVIKTLQTIGSGTTQPNQMVNVAGTLFFTANDGILALWKSDGTTAGTTSFHVGPLGAPPFDLTDVNGALFYRFDQENSLGREIRVAGLAANVLANDLLQSPQPITATLLQPVSHGTLTLNPDGTFIYRPNAGFSGDDTFTYAVTDGATTSSPATVTIHVTSLPPDISIANASVVEGNSGNTTLVFTITRSGPDLSGTASVDFATASGSAIAGSDYLAQSGTVTFAADETSKQVSVPVIGDTSDEGHEVFLLDLRNATGAALARTRAYGTIENDDFEADLQIAVTAAPTIGAGGTIHYDVVITNHGPSPATQVGMSLPVSVNQLLGVSATSPAGFCVVPLLFLVPAGEVFCDAGTLAPHASITLTVDATLKSNVSPGTFSATFTVSGHESDPQPANNHTTVETEIEPVVDMALAALAPLSGFPTAVGVPLPYRMIVANAGSNSAFTTRLRFVPPAGLQFVSATMPGAQCDFSGGVLTCDRDNFAGGTNVEAIIVMTPLGTGPTTASFDVSSPYVDPNPANNTITIAINRIPMAEAGANQNIATGGSTALVHLNGSGSTDADGDALGYIWHDNGTPIGTSAQLDRTLAIGNYTFALTVNDGRGGISTDSVFVVVHGSGLTAPTSVSAQATAPGSVVISWDPVPGATGYRILRSPDPVTFQIPLIDPPLHVVVGSPTTFDVTGPSSTIDSGLPTLVRQYYAVQATNGPIVSLPTPAAGGAVLVTAAPDAEIFGFADFHNHQFANLGFGRSLVWGSAFSPVDIFNALPPCEEIHGSGGVLDLIGNIKTTPPGSFPVPVPITVPSMTFTPPNQPAITTPSFTLFSTGHFTGGIAANNGISFNGWPRWNSITHQQVYHEWLRRAFDGGLRLMVMHALNNKLLCQIAGTMNQTLGNFSCNDVDNIDDQLNMAKSLEAFIDGRSGGPGKGWYRIAYSATDARRIINSGKMAVILGIEVDDLFGCSLASPCTEQFVRDRLNHYYSMGVRHLFPVHAFDNAFGGTALYDPLFDVGNRIIEGQFVVRRECGPEGYSYKAQPNQLATQLQLPDPGTTTFAADCNARPLQPLGDVLIREMMAKGMIIDIDHMSANTAHLVMARAEQFGYAGIIAGHSGSTSVLQGTRKSEGAKTPAQLARVRSIGGVSGIFLGQGDRVRAGNANGVLTHPGSTVLNDCGNSSKTFAQVYLATVDALGGPGTAAVGFGTDFNGLASMPGPRFGPEECWGDNERSPQSNRVTYPLDIAARPGVYAGKLLQTASPDRVAKNNPFDPFQNARPRPWDINEDGLAHVGMLPDFIQELRNVGVTEAQLQPLFRSAEGYISMWERAEATAPVVTPPASISVAGTEPGGARGNASADLHAFLAGGSAIAVGPVTRLAPQVAGATADDQMLFPVGTTTVTFRFSDAAGHIGSATADVTVVQGGGTVITDSDVETVLFADGTSIGTVTFDDVRQQGFVTATVLTAYPDLPAEFVALTPVYDIITTVLYQSVVTVCLNGSGFQPDDRLLHHEGGAWVDVTRGMTALAVCGQVASLSPFVAVRPVNHPPTAGAGSYPPVEATSAAGASVTLVGTASDPDAGDVLAFLWKAGASTIGTGPTITVVLPLGTHNLTLTVTDNRGLAATATAQVIVQDTTPPTLAPPPDQSVTATSATGAVVTYPPPVASDTASGVQSAHCAPASGSLFPIGATTVTCTATDGTGNAAAATFTVTVRAQSLVGRLFGIGFIGEAGQHHHFIFYVLHQNGIGSGRLEYWFNDPRVCSGDDEFSSGLDGSLNSHYGLNHHAPPKHFEATAITEVVVSDNPAFRPGWALGGEPKGDTVTVKGVGKWNGQPGYTFEALASDRGEPGRGRDRFSIVVRDSSGLVVANVGSALDAGNIQAANVLR